MLDIDIGHPDLTARLLGAVTTIDGSVSRNTTDLERYLNYSGDFEAITAEIKPV